MLEYRVVDMKAEQMGPVSAVLEAELRGFLRRHGIAVWLDVDNQYGRFVDDLVARRERDALPYEVLAWRGSHLRLMVGLESAVSGVGMRPVVIHMPGFNEKTIRETPVLEAYLAGKRFQKKLSTLVTEAAAGRVRPDDIVEFQEQKGMDLEAANRWLASRLEVGGKGLSGVLQDMGLVAIVEDLLSGGDVAGQVQLALEREALLGRLEALTGMSGEWLGEVLSERKVGAGDVAYAVSSWALCVEYVHDLGRAPEMVQLQKMVRLPGPVVEGCRELAKHLRERHHVFYQRTADDTEVRLGEEVAIARAADLGKIDTFRFEEDLVLKAALDALGNGDYMPAVAWAEQRVKVGSFWLEQDPARRSAWELVHGAAVLGRAIAAAGEKLASDGGFEGVVRQYEAAGAAVDQAHRHLEQRRAALLYTEVPEFETMRVHLDAMRRRWQVWADGWARDFNSLCKSHGFLPAPGLQQRNLFEEVVRPLTLESGPTVLFVVDALRYEMGEELKRVLEEATSTRVTLGARFAELPTVTAVGMNVLAPVALAGGLRPVFDGKAIRGFAAGEFQVTGPDSRRRAMHDRIGGTDCPMMSLEELVQRDSASLKKAVARAKLVIVHSQEIDNAGEKGVGPSVFDHVLQKLRAGWRLLRDAGVRRFVLTADHGFLLLDDLALEMQGHGRKVDPERRHVFSAVAADHPGEVRVALADLGYEGAEGFVMFPETTAVFDRGNKAANFVHGGNSLQERLVPVLTVRHNSPVGHETTRYRLNVQRVDGIAGLHCLRATVELAAQIALPFGAAKEVELALRVPELEDVQVELVQTRGGAASIRGAAIVARVGEAFELFFRLTGPREARVQVEVFHPSAVADVESARIDARYDVVMVRTAGIEESTEEVGMSGAAGIDKRVWLEALPAGGVRQVFEHLAVHGTVTEDEAGKMLGGARGLRIFSVKFDDYVRLVPFAVRIETVGNLKRYVREGRDS